MSFFRDQGDYETRLLVLEVTDNSLAPEEVEDIARSFTDSTLSSRVRYLRDKLIPFVPGQKRTELYALAVTSLSSEIKLHDIHANPHTVTDPSGERVYPTCKKAFDSLEILNLRLEQLAEMSWVCLYPNGSASNLLMVHPDISDLLYESSLILQNPKTAKALAKSAYLACDDHFEQANFLAGLISAFEDDDEMNSFAMDVLVSDTTPRNTRLFIFENLARLANDSINAFCNNGIELFTEVLPEPFYDEHIIRFLKAISENFGFEQARKVKKIARLVGIEIQGISSELGPTPQLPNKPVLGSPHEIKSLEVELNTRIDSLQRGIIANCRLF